MISKEKIKLKEMTEQVSDFIAMLVEIDDELKEIDEKDEETKCDLDNASEYLNMGIRHLVRFCELVDTAYNK